MIDEKELRKAVHEALSTVINKVTDYGYRMDGDDDFDDMVLDRIRPIIERMMAEMIKKDFHYETHPPISKSFMSRWDCAVCGKVVEYGEHHDCKG